MLNWFNIYFLFASREVAFLVIDMTRLAQVFQLQCIAPAASRTQLWTA